MDQAMTLTLSSQDPKSSIYVQVKLKSITTIYLQINIKYNYNMTNYSQFSNQLITTDHPLKLTVYGDYETILSEMIKHKKEHTGFVYSVDHCSLTELVLLVCTHDNHSKPSKEITLYV
jgi:hypothetical protein